MFKKPLYYFILLIICLAVLGAGLLLDKNASAVTQIEGSKDDFRQSEVGQGLVETLSPSLAQSRDFYRQLTAGDRFSLLLDAADVNSLVEVQVSRISIEGRATSIEGSLDTVENSVIMTIGDNFTHVFVSANNAIFEFSGKDFQGVLARTEDMRLSDDIAIFRDQPAELYSPKLQQLKTVNESLQ